MFDEISGPLDHGIQCAISIENDIKQLEMYHSQYLDNNLNDYNRKQMIRLVNKYTNGIEFSNEGMGNDIAQTIITAAGVTAAILFFINLIRSIWKMVTSSKVKNVNPAPVQYINTISRRPNTSKIFDEIQRDLIKANHQAEKDLIVARAISKDIDKIIEDTKEHVRKEREAAQIERERQDDIIEYSNLWDTFTKCKLGDPKIDEYIQELKSFESKLGKQSSKKTFNGVYAYRELVKSIGGDPKDVPVSSTVMWLHILTSRGWSQALAAVIKQFKIDDQSFFNAVPLMKYDLDLIEDVLIDCGKDIGTAIHGLNMVMKQDKPMTVEARYNFFTAILTTGKNIDIKEQIADIADEKFVESTFIRRSLKVTDIMKDTAMDSDMVKVIQDLNKRDPKQYAEEFINAFACCTDIEGNEEKIKLHAEELARKAMRTAANYIKEYAQYRLAVYRYYKFTSKFQTILEKLFD